MPAKPADTNTTAASVSGQSKRTTNRSKQAAQAEASASGPREESIVRETPPHITISEDKGKGRALSPVAEDVMLNQISNFDIRLDNVEQNMMEMDKRLDRVENKLDDLNGVLREIKELMAPPLNQRRRAPTPEEEQGFYQQDYQNEQYEEEVEPYQQEASQGSTPELVRMRDDVQQVTRDIKNLYHVMSDISRHTSRTPAPPPAPPAPNRTSAALSKEKAIDIAEPDTYSGKPEKLRDFLTQLRIVFRAKPVTYSEDRDKIMYAISRCKGLAHKHFRRALDVDDEEDMPAYMHSWPEFTKELKSYFGYQDEDREAEQELKVLRMKDDGTALSYIVEFTELAERVEWDQKSLASHFYQGLAWRIKERMFNLPNGAPKSLEKLKTTAVRCDRMDKEEERERKRSRPTTFSSSSHIPKKTFATSKTTKPAYSSKPHSFPKSNAATYGSSKPASNSEVSKHLKPDGTLKEAEKERRRREGLCTYCASSKHIVANCPKRADKQQSVASKPNSFGRVAEAEEYSEPSSEVQEDTPSESESDAETDLEYIDEDPDAQNLEEENFEAASDME